MILVIILIPFVLYFSSLAYHKIHASLLSSETRWLRDLDTFEKSLLEKHVDPDWATLAKDQIEKKN